MMLLVRGGALYYVGGAPQGYLTDNWRAFWPQLHRKCAPVWPDSLCLDRIARFWRPGLFLFHRTHLGKQILSIGDNVRASQLSGVRVRLVRLITFVLCSVFAIIGASCSAASAGERHHRRRHGDAGHRRLCRRRVLLGGGKGSVPNAIFGAFTLQAIVNLLNLLGLPKPYTDAVQGLIIIAAVAYVGLSTQKKR